MPRMSASAFGRKTTSSIRELFGDELVEIERARWPAFLAFADQLAEALDARVAIGGTPHGIANDFAGRTEGTGLHLSAGVFGQFLAEGDRGVFAGHALLNTKNW